MRFLVFALPLGGAAAAIAVGLSRAAWPSADFWTKHGEWIFWAIIAAGVIPAAQTTIAELGEKKRRKELEREEYLRSLLVTALVYVVRECNAVWDLTGVQVFLVTGWWRRARQVRVAKVRLASAPPGSVVWTKGKGVIGLCWETRTSHTAYLDRPPFSELGTVPDYRWLEIDERTRYGLSFDEYRAFGRRYGTVIALPIMSKGKYVGCVTLDMPPEHRLTQPEKALEFLATTSDLVRRFLEI
jgi:hypothetical protein